MAGSGEAWTPTSWKSRPILQNPFADSTKDMAPVASRLQALPGLVQPQEIENLRASLKDVASGKKFLLQGGDCAERFLDCDAGLIEAKLKILLQMSLVISWAGKKPVVRVGRMAGQYAKPRSSPKEVVDGREVFTYRGDCVNAIEPHSREPDPDRLLQGYFHSAATLNCIRTLVSSGFADLHESQHWQLDYVQRKETREKYGSIVDHLLTAMNFMELCGSPTNNVIKSVDFFTSHEALILDFESSLARQYNGAWYDTSAHFVWIGDRTRQLEHGHVEFCRGIANPIGLKVGPSSIATEIVKICRRLNPTNEEGKIVLITRFGDDKVNERLPLLIQEVQLEGVKVIFQCDPMHGNTTEATFKGDDGRPTTVKTRRFEAVLGELEKTAHCLKASGLFLGGVHFELTGEDVTECTGGPQELQDSHLSLRYNSYCDPRLNYAQSMEMSFLIAKILADCS